MFWSVAVLDLPILVATMVEELVLAFTDVVEVVPLTFELHSMI